METLREAVLAVRQAQIALLEPGLEKEADKFAAAQRNLDRAFQSVYKLNLKSMDVPPGPLRDCIKEIAPYFVDRKGRWASEE